VYKNGVSIIGPITILMVPLLVSFLFFVLSKDVDLVIGWDPSNFTFNPGANYELIWQDEFENIGPVQAIINGQPAYAPNPKNWFHLVGPNIDGGMQNCTDSIQNAYVQNNQLTIVAMKEPFTSAMLRSQHLQEFIFGKFAAKIRLPYEQRMWPAWWLGGNNGLQDFKKTLRNFMRLRETFIDFMRLRETS
jgi:beta-glucanase (GH16 family)